MKRHVTILSLILIVLFTSCRKDETATPDQPATPTNISDLKAPSGFSWSTSQSVTIEVTGLKSNIPFVRTLSFIAADGTIVFQQTHNINDDLTAVISIPSEVSQLRMKFGQLSTDLPVVNGKLTYSFIPVDNGE
ncbi:MAG: hypothetical protein PHQ65_01160 [Bacteroidales bacterium]|nr:hypothetical protein [Bacteroidales bacterium]MDD3663849.1 hypothetical protein [Bacteroidales bacterium]